MSGGQERRALPRQLGFWSAVAVLIGSTIGSGIFRSPAGIADKLPGPLALLAVWVMGGLFALCGALTLAEVGSAFPETGGIFVFIREAFGRMPAFAFGWSELVIIRAASLGAISKATTAPAWRRSAASMGPLPAITSRRPSAAQAATARSKRL